MKQEIIVKYQNYCGKDLYYPDSDGAKALLDMCTSGNGRRKAFVERDIRTLEALGIEVKILHPRIEVTYEEQ